jgi:glycosyltransferase involved in cell wall biosynthesis
MRLTIVIPAYNEEKYIGQCLKSCTEHASEFLEEIIVVDNASTDATAEVAKRFPKVRVVEETQKGLTHARQRGLMEIRTELYGSIDADMRLTREWFLRVEEAFRKDPSLICVSGPYTFHDLPLFHRFLAALYWAIPARIAYLFLGFMVVGGNFVAKVEALKAIGGFDTSVSFYGEDTNIARRLSAVGKMKFLRALTLKSSGRRLAEEGLLKTGWIYVINFLSEVFRKKPYTHSYKDIR